jgi:hypothetical protein
MVKRLYDELRTRFPEIGPEMLAGSEEPYAIMGDLVLWLDSRSNVCSDEKLIQRLVDFANWCELQPRGETASDDLWTIFVVGFVENLFLCDHTKCLIPRLVSWERFNENKVYLVSWVGQENYKKAAGFYPGK